MLAVKYAHLILLVEGLASMYNYIFSMSKVHCNILNDNLHYKKCMYSNMFSFVVSCNCSEVCATNNDQCSPISCLHTAQNIKTFSWKMNSWIALLNASKIWGKYKWHIADYCYLQKLIQFLLCSKVEYIPNLLPSILQWK